MAADGLCSACTPCQIRCQKVAVLCSSWRNASHSTCRSVQESARGEEWAGTYRNILGMEVSQENLILYYIQ